MLGQCAEKEPEKSLTRNYDVTKGGERWSRKQEEKSCGKNTSVGLYVKIIAQGGGRIGFYLLAS